MELFVIMPFGTESGLNNLLETLENNLPDFVDSTMKLRIVAYTNEQHLFLEARKEIDSVLDSVDVYDMERIVQFTQTLSYNEAKNIIRKPIGVDDAFVFLWNENVVVPRNALVMLSDEMRFNKAGLISGHFIEYPITYKVEDVYNNMSKKISWADIELQDGLNPIDTIFPYGVITKFDNYYEFNFKNDGLNGLGFGLELRRQGFQNYVDTTIKYKYGEKHE